MRSNVETKKCHGCNAILSLRESCKACADKARARLHAEGFCRRDGTGQPYDCGKPPLGSKPDWASLKLPSGRAMSMTPAPGVDVADFFIGVDPGYHDTAVAVTSRRLADGTMEILDMQLLGLAAFLTKAAEVAK